MNINLIDDNKNDKIIEMINKDKSLLTTQLYKHHHLIHLCIIKNNYELIKKIIEINSEQLLLINKENDTILLFSISNKNIKIINLIIDLYIKYQLNNFKSTIDNFNILTLLLYNYEFDDFKIVFNKIYLYIKDNDYLPYLILFYYYDKNDIYTYLSKFKYANNDYFYQIIELYFNKNISIDNVKKLLQLFPYLLKFKYNDYDRIIIYINSYHNKKNEYIEFIKLLLELGLNYNIHYDYTIFLNDFIKYNMVELINILLQKDDIIDSINYIDSKYQTSISYSLTYIDDKDINKKTIDLTLDMNLQNIYGNTPLHLLFIRKDFLDYYDNIKSKKLDLYIKNKLNNKPIDNIKNNDIKIFIEKYRDNINSDKELKQFKNICKNNNNYKKYE